MGFSGAFVSLHLYSEFHRAGFRVKSAAVAAVNAHRLLKKPHIAAAVQARIAERTERTQERADWVIKRLVMITNRCLEAKAVRDRNGKPTGIFTFDSSGANRSLELIGKHLQMFTAVRDIKTRRSLQRATGVGQGTPCRTW